MLPSPHYIPYSILTISVLFYKWLCEEEIERDREDISNMLILWVGCHIATHHFLSPKDHGNIKYHKFLQQEVSSPKRSPHSWGLQINQHRLPGVQTAKLPAAVLLPKGEHGQTIVCLTKSFSILIKRDMGFDQ